jgi:hypothetical protein
MTKSKKVNKRKKGSRTDEELEKNRKILKACEGLTGAASNENNISVSEVVNITNSVLFDDTLSTPLPVFEDDHLLSLNERDQSLGNNESITTSDISTVDKNFQSGKMEAEINFNPINADILCYLKKIDAKIENMDVKSQSLEALENRAGNQNCVVSYKM